MGMADTGREGRVYRGAARQAVEALCDQHARRRAARWHAWLLSPECTSQDRENFERWCLDARNAAAYVALCGNLAEAPEHSAGNQRREPRRPAFSSLELRADTP